MTDEKLIVLLIIAVALSKMIIGFLIYYLVKRNRELKSDRNLLSEHNEILKNHLEIIEKQRQQLKEAENFKLKILSIASHYLKTPFNDLKLIFDNFDFIKSRPDIIMNSMVEVKGQLYSIKETIDNILSWTTAHLKKPRHELQVEFNLNQNIHSVINLYDNRIMQKRIKLNTSIAQDYYTIGSSEIFNFAIRNLLNNAIKFSPTDSEIEIMVSENGNLGKISIKDYGVGMDLDRVKKIDLAEYHHSELGTNNEKGTGIGLALCKELLKMQGWQLKVESLKGQGTQMQLILPIERSEYLN